MAAKLPHKQFRRKEILLQARMVPHFQILLHDVGKKIQQHLQAKTRKRIETLFSLLYDQFMTPRKGSKSLKIHTLQIYKSITMVMMHQSIFFDILALQTPSKLRSKTLKISLLLIFLVGNIYATTTQPSPIKIACIGNSITYGLLVENRVRNAYPAQLQAMLGEDYHVRNFGINSCTLLTKGDKPYIGEPTYQAAKRFKPDILFIALGANDAKAVNRVFLDDFEADYTALINDFKTVNPQIRIVLMTPLPSFSTQKPGIWQPIFKDKILPKIAQVAFDMKLEILDMQQLFINQPELFIDQVHPSSLGATLIARRLYEVIVRENIPSMDLPASKEIKHILTDNFHGYTNTLFDFKTWKCQLVKPKKAALGRPWVLRARFFGHEPQTDIALLERGFHIAYCDVSGFYGNPQAMQRWDAFYSLLTQWGLSKKVVLEGMSRGGLPVYNWAAKHPDRIACIYADAPVLDGKSWPKNHSASHQNWMEFKKRYGLKTAMDVTEFNGSPIDKTAQIARGGFPMLHVCGADDKVVPIAQNTQPFAASIRDHGGQVEVIYKPNNGHHPHSLKNPTPIVDFILKATAQKINLAKVAAPSGEYRSGAGWRKKTDWWTQAFDIDSLCRNSGKIDVLFLGNSITQGWGGKRPNVPYAPGRNALQTYFKNLKVIVGGISGDRTQNILWRLKYGHYEACNPDYIVLSVGVNNLIEHDSAEEIAAGVREIVMLIKNKFSEKTKVLLFGPLPTGTNPDSKRRKQYKAIQKNIQSLISVQNLIYCDPITLMTDAKGFLKPHLYASDGIHLKEAGYVVWGRYIKSIIERDMTEN